MKENRVSLYHGSMESNLKPDLSKGPFFSDFGMGFYCFPDFQEALLSSIRNGIPGFVYFYHLSTRDIAILDLTSSPFVWWVSLVLLHHPYEREELRAFGPNISSFLKKNPVSINGFDLIKGYRADGVNFRYVMAFVKGQLDFAALEKAVKMDGKALEYCLLSSKAIANLSLKKVSKSESVSISGKEKRNKDEEDEFASFMKGVVPNHGKHFNKFLKN